MYADDRFGFIRLSLAAIFGDERPHHGLTLFSCVQLVD